MKAVDKIFKLRGVKKSILIGSLTGILEANNIFVGDIESQDKAYWKMLASSLPKESKLELNRIVKEVINGKSSEYK